VPEANQKVVILTGAARGIGLAMTLALAKAGLKVAAIDLKSDMLELRAAAAKAGVERDVVRFAADVADADDCAAVLDRIVERCGSLYGLVNNAAIGMQGIGNVLVGERKKFYEVDPRVWKTVFDVNANGPFFMTRAVAPLLVAQRRGRVVNIVTSLPTMVAQGFSPYGPTKAALEAATVIWAKDLEGTGVTVNALLPGGAANTRMIPVKEVPDRSTLVQPGQMGPPLVWLMSDASDAVTGKRVIAKDWAGEGAQSRAGATLAAAGW
jgi:3-oxoacyl-[acyl-carrier protein] reductase